MNEQTQIATRSSRIPQFSDELRPKERRFVLNFLESLDPEAAYKKAGYAARRGARQAASRLMAKPAVQEALRSAMEPLVEEFPVTAERLVRRLQAITDFDVVEIFNDDWTLKPPSEWSENVRQCVRSIKIDEVTSRLINVQFVDKVKTIELLCRHLGMFIDRQEVVHVNGDELIERLNAGRDRVRRLREADTVDADDVEDAEEID